MRTLERDNYFNLNNDYQTTFIHVLKRVSKLIKGTYAFLAINKFTDNTLYGHQYGIPIYITSTENSMLVSTNKNILLQKEVTREIFDRDIFVAIARPYHYCNTLDTYILLKTYSLYDIDIDDVFNQKVVSL